MNSHSPVWLSHLFQAKQMGQDRQPFTGMSDSDASKKKKKLFFILFASFLLVTALVAVVSTSIANSKKNSKNSSPAHAILRSSCSVTRFPELCFSTVTNAPGAIERLTSKKDVIETIVNLTLTSVEHNYFTIKKIIKTHKGTTVREKRGLHDCLELVDETRDELHEAREDLEEYPNNKKNKSLSEIADDLKILLSGAMTNQETCLDGFSHEKADKVVREIFIAGQIHVYQMCSNALALIKSLTDEDIKNEQTLMKSNGRKLIEDQNNDEFPAWLSVGDRKLLQSGTVTPDATVATDGSGNFRTVAAAVAAAPARSTRRYVIRIKAGVYRENVEVPKTKTNLMFLGDGRKNTIITGSRNVVDGSTTFNSATVAVVGERFLARGVTFQNTAGPSKHQAVALRVGSDFSAFYECDVLAYQDTLYVHSLRQFYINCLIAGTVDFIFGNAAVVLQDCDIHARRPNNGQRNMLTAQGRDDPNQNTGIVIQKCRIGATSDLLPVQSSFPTYLGRPWKEYSRTIVMQSTISNVIHPAGWFEWNGNFALNTLFYAEYQNTGAGAGTSGRVKWRGYKVITSATEAQTYTAGSFLQGSGWLGSTGFPFSLAL